MLSDDVHVLDDLEGRLLKLEQLRPSFLHLLRDLISVYINQRSVQGGGDLKKVVSAQRPHLVIRQEGLFDLLDFLIIRLLPLQDAFPTVHYIRNFDGALYPFPKVCESTSDLVYLINVFFHHQDVQLSLNFIDFCLEFALLV